MRRLRPADGRRRLAAGLARVLAGQDTADARAARRRRAREFTWDRTADRTVEAYLGAS